MTAKPQKLYFYFYGTKAFPSTHPFDLPENAL